MKRKCYAMAAALALLAPAAAIAEAPTDGSAPAKAEQNKRPALARLLKTADGNGDGKLDLAEIHTKLPEFPQQRFSSLDKNQDGFLEANELPGRDKAASPPVPAQKDAGAMPEPEKRPALVRLLKAADANSDSKLDLDEIHARLPDFPRERFAALDKNQDGFLEAGELPGGGEVAPAVAPVTAPGAGARGEVAKKLRAADTDKDGKLSQAEFSAGFPNAPSERFKMMDRNGDGFVDPADREAAGATPEMTERIKNRALEGRGLGAEAGPYVKRLIQTHDNNQDGTLTKDELLNAKPGFPDQTFSALDRDKDGVLTAADAPEAGAGV